MNDTDKTHHLKDLSLGGGQVISAAVRLLEDGRFFRDVDEALLWIIEVEELHRRRRESAIHGVMQADQIMTHELPRSLEDKTPPGNLGGARGVIENRSRPQAASADVEDEPSR